MVDQSTELKSDPMAESSRKEREEATRAENAGEGVRFYDSNKPSSQDTSYQNYLFAKAGKSDAPAWTDTTKGRLIVRFISRGLVGAAFFVAGSRMATNQLNGYQPDTWDPKRPLQWIAKGIDVTLTPLIRNGVTLFARIKHPKEVAEAIGRQAVNFRDTRNITYTINNHTMKGRTYGAELVGFTFDFAAMSVGDALTRNIIQAFDPNVKKSWKINDQGKPAAKGEHWHFAPGEFAKWMGQTAWRIVSKNQMEDWVAGIPYAFQMKFQRHLLSNMFAKRWEGHKLVFDHTWNGGAYRMNQAGQIVGDYQLPAVLDLHFRFVGYNVYTQMFREGYDAFARQWKDWREHGYQINLHLPKTEHPISDTVDWLGKATRYVIKSTIKANMYMHPAMPFFWLTRVPQSKWRGREYVNEQQTAFGAHTNIWKTPQNLAAGETILKPYAWSNYEHYPTTTMLDKAEKGFSMALNPIGWASNKIGTKAADFSDFVLGKNWEPKQKWLRHILGDAKGNVQEGRRKFFHEYTDAAIAYTPYIAAKQEFGLRVDDARGDGKPGQMDLAIYKFMDDVAGLKFKEIPDDVKKMWVLGTNFERDVKVREGDTVGEEAQPLAAASEKPNLPMMPKTVVTAGSIRRAPAANMPGQETSPKRAASRAEAANDANHGHGRSWTQQAVAGSDVQPEPRVLVRH